MDIDVMSASGGAAKKVQLSDSTFAQEFNEALVHQVVTAYLAGGRAGTHAQKTRAQVRGGGRKPFAQKGTGRARAGTIRSPLWRGGGKIFAAVTNDYSQKVNRKMYRAALRSIVSELLRQERLVVIDELKIDAPKTKQLAGKLKGWGLANVLIVTEQIESNVELAARNLRAVDACEVSKIDPVSLIRAEKVLMTSGAVKKLEEMLA